MNQSDEDALVNEIFDKSWRTEPGAQTSLFNMAESIRLAIRAAVAAERERDEARELSVQGSARLFAAMNFERDEWKRKANAAAEAGIAADADNKRLIEVFHQEKAAREAAERDLKAVQFERDEQRMNCVLAERKAEEAARDAGRYAWVRSSGLYWSPTGRVLANDKLDAAIDAIAAKGEA